MEKHMKSLTGHPEEVSAKDENGQDTTKRVVYAVLTDGNKIQFDKGTITYTENGETKTATMEDYEVKGIKYVPVAVKQKIMQISARNTA